MPELTDRHMDELLSTVDGLRFRSIEATLKEGLTGEDLAVVNLMIAALQKTLPDGVPVQRLYSQAETAKLGRFGHSVVCQVNGRILDVVRPGAGDPPVTSDEMIRATPHSSKCLAAPRT
jgi:hypothetical protein